MSRMRLSKAETRILEQYWKLGTSSIREILDSLLEDERVAYTTVQTMLNILERKGKLKRQLQGRAYVYTARVTEGKALGQGVRDLIDRMFGGSSEELVMSLLKNRQIDAKKLAELTKRFNEEGSREEL